MNIDWKYIKEILERFHSFYWNSEIRNQLSLIDDLRLSTNIHETAHSRVLYKFLCAYSRNPYEFLLYFLDIVGLEKELDMDKVEIEVEHKGIDVLIYDGNKYIIIENKVNHADDQDRQLSRYIEELPNSKNVYILYLVRFAKDKGPSESSLTAELKKKLEKEGRFYKISYEVHIRKWLEICCLNVKKDKLLLYSALIQYQHYLEQLFLGGSCMDKSDADAFVKDILGDVNTTSPKELFEKADMLKSQIQLLDNIIDNYKKYLCESYLERFKKDTGIDVARINNHFEIEFSLKISDVGIMCTYDFLNLSHAEYVWFGMKYPLIQYDGGNVDETELKKIDKITTKVLKNYGVDPNDNWESCAKDDFKKFSRTGGWLFKYCQNQDAAVEDIKKFKYNVCDSIICEDYELEIPNSK